MMWSMNFSGIWPSPVLGQSSIRPVIIIQAALWAWWRCFEMFWGLSDGWFSIADFFLLHHGSTVTIVSLQRPNRLCHSSGLNIVQYVHSIVHHCWRPSVKRTNIGCSFLILWTERKKLRDDVCCMLYKLTSYLFDVTCDSFIFILIS